MRGRIEYLLSKGIKKLINIPAIKNCKIDKTSRICSGSHIVDSSMKRYSYIGNFCTVLHTEIGSFCSIADNCTIGGASHPIEWVSTSPVFHSGRNIMNKNFSNHAFEPMKMTYIGNDVWIGTNCILKSGITVGDGAIIGMGSVVTKSVEPYTIVAGVPAKIIKKRFDDETISKIQATMWWNYNEEKLKQLARNINDVNRFLVSTN